MIDAGGASVIIILESLGKVGLPNRARGWQAPFVFKVLMVDRDCSIRFFPYWRYDENEIRLAKIGGRIVNV